MSWKPCRGSGLMFDKHSAKARKYRQKLDELLPVCNPPSFKQINYLSKCFYLYYLNDNKAAQDIGRRSANQRPFEQYVPDYFLNIFRNNKEYIYKPLQKLLTHA